MTASAQPPTPRAAPVPERLPAPRFPHLTSHHLHSPRLLLLTLHHAGIVRSTHQALIALTLRLYALHHAHNPPAYLAAALHSPPTAPLDNYLPQASQDLASARHHNLTPNTKRTKHTMGLAQALNLALPGLIRIAR